MITLRFDDGDFEETCGCGCDCIECDEPNYRLRDSGLPLVRRLLRLRTLAGSEREDLETITSAFDTDEGELEAVACAGPTRLRQILQHHYTELIP